MRPLAFPVTLVCRNNSHAVAWEQQSWQIPRTWRQRHCPGRTASLHPPGFGLCCPTHVSHTLPQRMCNALHGLLCNHPHHMSLHATLLCHDSNPGQPVLLGLKRQAPHSRVPASSI